MERINKDNYYLNIAISVAARSTCLRHNFGAVIVKDDKIISTGFNGAPSGFPHCYNTGCIRDKEGIPSGTRMERCAAVHAEQNAIIQGSNMKGAAIYVNGIPCITCCKMIINAGIVRVVYLDNDYPDKDGINMLRGHIGVHAI